MSSRQLSSILKTAPAATVSGQRRAVEQEDDQRAVVVAPPPVLNSEQQARIVAEIPMSLKEEIKLYIKANKGMTEKIVLLKALKLMGFNVQDKWLIDNRSTR